MSPRPPVPWPDGMSRLLPGLSASPRAAMLPPHIRAARTSARDEDQVAGWNGLWKGRGGLGHAVDAMLAVRRETDDRLALDWTATDGRSVSMAESVDVRQIDDELVATLPNGSSLRLRRRDGDTVEFMHDIPTGHRVCGTLARWRDDIECVHERIPTPLRENGEPVSLTAVVYRPRGEGPFPALLFNHGSTIQDRKPSLFVPPWTCLPLVRFFVERGWLVVFPQRRGRSGSDGRCAEGTVRDAKGYRSNPEPVRAGFRRGLEDIDAASAWLHARHDVDPTRTVIAGHSRGGVLALAHAATRAWPYHAALDFAGGWLGHTVANSLAVNTELFEQGAAFDGPTRWLYSDRDTYYPLDHTRACFDAFVAAGGTGTFHEIHTCEGQDGHQLVHVPSRWHRVVDELLVDIDLSSSPEPARGWRW